MSAEPRRTDLRQGWRAIRSDLHAPHHIGRAALVLASVCILPVVGWLAVAGWRTVLLRQLLQQDQRHVPPFTLDMRCIAAWVAEGWRPWIVRLAWCLPAAALFCGAHFGLWFGVYFAGPKTVAVPIWFWIVMYACLLPILFLSAWLAELAALRVVLSKQLEDGFEMPAVLAMFRQVRRELLTRGLLLTLLWLLTTAVGLACLLVGVFPALIVASVITAHYTAQLYALALQDGMKPLGRQAL